MDQVPAGLLGAFAFVFGASIGSFVNVVAYRLPREISIAYPRSYCAKCEQSLPWWANIPILSYIGLRGRCFMCGAPLPLRHLMAELGLAVIALYLYLSFPLPDAAARFLLCAALFLVALIDYDWRLIPNLITMPGIFVGFFAAAFLMPEIGWKSSLAGIVIGAGTLFLTGQLYLLVRGREGVGMGDVWLLGMIGGFLGWPGVLFTLFVGSILGSVGGTLAALFGSSHPAAESPEAERGGSEADISILRTEVPFGPFLALAAGFFAVFQPALVRWYLSG